ncbi:MAG TPA: alpha/beta hydrolase [Acidimicrobiales bacterium]|nr:alpha/beta hydrolase [Acidimicrobiales bacterium]
MEALEVTAGDGTRLVCWDFGGNGPTILMMHGAGLHGRCWAPVARALSAGFRPIAMDLRGHGASGRSPDGLYGWESFATDALTAVEQLGLARPGQGSPKLVGVGHSAGASALVMAERARPGTFAGLWAWEPIITIPGSHLTASRSAALAERARRRRAEFPSIEQARSHLEGRGLFAEFSPEAFEAFLEGGFISEAGGGVRLACGPDDEARVYEGGLSRSAWEDLGHFHPPARVLGGGHSKAVPFEELEAITAQLPAGELATIAGLGHFGPFGDPPLVAADIARWST